MNSEHIATFEQIVSSNKAKFEASIDLAFVLNVDPKKQDTSINDLFLLPNNNGSKSKIAAIVSDDYIEAAKGAGAEVIGGVSLIDEIKRTHGKNLKGVDFCVANLSMMSELGQVAKFLGPKKIMPSIKLGTATNDLSGVIEKIKTGRLSKIRTDKYGILHVKIGSVKSTAKDLEENLRALTTRVLGSPGSKPGYIKKVFASSTMGKSFRIV